MESKIMTLVEESCVLSARNNSEEENESKREQNLSQVRNLTLNLFLQIEYFFYT